MLARRINEPRDITQNLVHVTKLGRPALDAARGKQSLDLLLGKRELAQGDRERLVAGWGRVTLGVQLDAHARPGERVAKLMRQPGRELGQQPGSLRLFDRLPHSFELRAHPVDRRGEVRHLVVPRCPGASSRNSPAAIPATCCCTRLIRALMRWAIQLVTITIAPSEPSPRSNGGIAASHRAWRQLVSG